MAYVNHLLPHRNKKLMIYYFSSGNFSKYYETDPVCDLPPDKKVELAKEVMKRDFVKSTAKITSYIIIKVPTLDTRLEESVDLVNDPKCEIVKIGIGPTYYKDNAYHFATGKADHVNKGIKYYLKWDDNNGVYVAQTVEVYKRLWTIYHVPNLTSAFPTLKKDELGLRKRISQKRSARKNKNEQNKDEPIEGGPIEGEPSRGEPNKDKPSEGEPSKGEPKKSEPNKDQVTDIEIK